MLIIISYRIFMMLPSLECMTQVGTTNTNKQLRKTKKTTKQTKIYAPKH